MTKINIIKGSYKCMSHSKINVVLNVDGTEYDEKDKKLFNGNYCVLCIIEHLRSNWGLKQVEELKE